MEEIGFEAQKDPLLYVLRFLALTMHKQQ